MEILDSLNHYFPTIYLLILGLILCVSLFLFSLTEFIWEIWKCLDRSTLKSNFPTEQLTVSKIEFIRQIVAWCIENLGFPYKMNRWPKITLRYYRHKKWGGTYHQATKEITLYWGSHSQTLDIINTIIHEYQHFLDIRDGKDDVEYSKEMETVGYHKNFFERRARKVASKWERSCYDDLVKKGIIQE